MLNPFLRLLAGAVATVLVGCTTSGYISTGISTGRLAEQAPRALTSPKLEIPSSSLWLENLSFKPLY